MVDFIASSILAYLSFGTRVIQANSLISGLGLVNTGAIQCSALGPLILIFCDNNFFNSTLEGLFSTLQKTLSFTASA